MTIVSSPYILFLLVLTYIIFQASSLAVTIVHSSIILSFSIRQNTLSISSASLFSRYRFYFIIPLEHLTFLLLWFFSRGMSNFTLVSEKASTKTMRQSHNDDTKSTWSLQVVHWLVREAGLPRHNTRNLFVAWRLFESRFFNPRRIFILWSVCLCRPFLFCLLCGMWQHGVYLYLCFTFVFDISTFES